MDRMPTFFDQLVFQAKATIFRLSRFIRDQLSSSKCGKWPLCAEVACGRLLGESKSALFDLSAPYAERVLQMGKAQNLRVAIRRLDGCLVPGQSSFSFWKQVGWPGRWRGYVRGRELRQGCLIPTIAGGLCQLSNALHDAALQAGFTIEERHAHTQVIPGSLSETGRDATLFWNYVDLRFRSAHPFQIRITMSADELIVQLWGNHDA
jgi:vancomycin resistance protein VanW